MNNKSNDFSISFQSGNFFFHHSLSRMPSKDIFYKHSHQRYELYVFFEGDVECIVEDRIYALKSDSLLLIHPLTYHYVKIGNRNRPYHRLIVNFDKNFVFPELHAFVESSDEFFIFDSAQYMPVIEECEAAIYTHAREDSALLIQIFVNRLFMDLKYKSKKTAKLFQPPNTSVQKILEFINQHLYEPLSLNYLAENLYLSPTYLSQLFSSHMKIGIMDYIKQKKIIIAQDLIRQGIKPTEAAKRLGFSEYSTFYRLYMKFNRARPSEPKQ